MIDMEGEGRCLFERLLPVEKAKKALETLRKYDTLQEVYFDGQGYADQDKLDNICHYQHNPYMRDYVLKSRTGVQDIMALTNQRNQDMDKVQALFADMEEIKRARIELERPKQSKNLLSEEENYVRSNKGINTGDCGRYHRMAAYQQYGAFNTCGRVCKAQDVGEFYVYV